MNCVKAQRRALLFPQATAISFQMLSSFLGLCALSGAAGRVPGATGSIQSTGSECPTACPLWAGAWTGAAVPTSSSSSTPKTNYTSSNLIYHLSASCFVIWCAFHMFLGNENFDCRLVFLLFSPVTRLFQTSVFCLSL